MFFYTPYAFILLFIPLWLLFRKDQKRSPLPKHFSKQMIEKLQLHNTLFSPTRKHILFSLILALFIIALARPVSKRPTLQLPQNKPAVVLALDVSKSMHTTDIYPSRLALARKKLEAFVSKASALSMGILLYAQDAYMLYPLTHENTTLSYLLKDANFSHPFAPQTNLFAALEGGTQLLKTHKNRHIILLTDDNSTLARTQELHYLQNKNTKLSVLSLTQGTPSTLQTLCKESGGIYQSYTWTQEDISTIIQHIIATPIISQTKNYDVENLQEYFMYPLALGLLLLMLLFLPLQKRVLPPFMLLFIMLSISLPVPSHASMLDFWYLHQAKNATQNKDYTKAIAMYKKADLTPEGYYNLANTLYKASLFIESITYYKKALGKDKAFNAKIYYNIATAYAHKHKLDFAKENYKKSLALHEYQVTRDNLQTIQKLLKIQRKNLHKAYQKLVFKPVAPQKYTQKSVFSDYSIKLQKLLPDQEQQWFDKILKHKNPVYLQKLHTTRRSQDASLPY
jgi:Ca-activated chloride channel family protein